MNLEMTKGKYTAIFIVFTLIVLFAVEVGAGDWTQYARKDNGDKCFYDTQSVMHSENTIKVWNKIVWGDKSIQEIIQKFSDIHGIENVSYWLHRLEVDCSKTLFRVTDSAFYDSDGKSIFSRNYHNNEFVEINPDSFVNKLAKIICKKKDGGEQTKDNRVEK